ncbi:MAG: outer membrane beta-barrel protein [Bacteroidota bacterium]
MSFKFIALIVSWCCTSAALAQNSYVVKGLVSDTTTNQKLDDATISVLDARDSILQKFTYTNKGVFEISNLKAGKFLLMVTYPDYADFVEHFTLDAAHPQYDFGNIRMILKSKLLNEVIIKARMAAIKIKGDTTEFNAAAYATQKNAKVDELLRQLPGMKINQSGAILFQGEEVSKILVDGEEFFTDDPTLVSKTVRADMVSKVQVYDQKSEQAKLTGMEDGVKVKTINIVLREDKKKGVFGKAEGGYGTDDYYLGQAALSKFSPKEKISAYGSLSNTGQSGLSGSDADKFSTGSGTFSFGLPANRDAGLHYDSKWNKDKQSVNGNYNLNRLRTEDQSSSVVQNNLPGNFNTSSRIAEANYLIASQSADVNLKSKIDSVSDLNMQVRGSTSRRENKGISNGVTLRGNGVLLNESERTSTGSSESKNVNLSASYTRRFKKKGRSLSVNAASSYGESEGAYIQISDLRYYNPLGLQDSMKHIDQYNPNSSANRNVSGGFSYTDVFSKTLNMSAGYNLSASSSEDQVSAFDRASSPLNNLLDSALSSDFKLKTLSGRYNAALNYAKDKVSANVALSATDVRYRQNNALQGTRLNRDFMNWMPNANFRYQLSKAASLSLAYNGETRQPGAYQLQPLRQNADPLNITIGNPELKPEFSNRFSYNYRVYQPTQDQGINFRGNYQTTFDAIVSNRTTDSAGTNIYQWSNLSDARPGNWNLYTEFYGHATKLDFIVSINLTVDGSVTFNYINNQLNKSKYVSYSPQLDIWKNKGTYSYSFSVGPSYTTGSSSLQQAINNNTKGFFTSLNYYTKLPLNFFMGSDINYKYSAKNQVFDRSFEQLLIKSYVGRTFLKSEGLKVTLTGNDLLNQNTGYSRSSSQGSFSESRNATIKRYFMFSLSWDFSKFGKSLQPESGS